jgi:hypothetical protein
MYNLLIINARYWNRLVCSFLKNKINTSLTDVIQALVGSVTHMYDCFLVSRFIVHLDTYSGEGIICMVWSL